MSVDPATSASATAGRRLVGKAVLDRSVAALLLLSAGVWLLLIAVAVRLDNPGPVLHRSRRLGLDGRAFALLDFRTTLLAVPPGTTAGPARVRVATPVGRVLQRSGLDHLPRLVNVLRGEMSLVGPPPQEPAEGGAAPLPVRPGLIGPRVPSGGRGPECLCAEEYVRRWSIGLDLVIIGRALRAGLTPGGPR